jgi:ankyrin repeat protein
LSVNNLNDYYLKATWTVVLFSGILITLHFFDSKVSFNDYFLIIKSPEDSFKIVFGLFVISWLFQAVQWGCCDASVKKKYRSTLIHIATNSLALYALYISYPTLTYGSSLQNSPLWWHIVFLIIGVLTGVLTSIIALALLLIRSETESKKLGLPRIPSAVKSQYTVWTPLVLLFLLVYFFLQKYNPYDTVVIDSILFSIAFLKEIFQELISYYFTQDDKGNRLSFYDRVKSIKEALNKHDYQLLINSMSDECDFIGKNRSPSQIQTVMQEMYSNPDDLKYQAQFQGKTNAGTLQMLISFDDKSMSDITIEIPEAWFKEELDKFVLEHSIDNEDTMNLAVSHAFHRSITRYWSETNIPKFEPSINDLVISKQLEILKLKVSEGSDDLNQIDSGGWTPALHAAAQGYTDILELLLDNGANPDIANIKEITPLHYAARYENISICKLLVEHGANPNKQDEFGNTALMIAAQLGNIEILKMLLNSGADINVKNKLGLNAKDIAEKNKHGKLARVLRTHC